MLHQTWNIIFFVIFFLPFDIKYFNYQKIPKTIIDIDMRIKKIQ